MAKIIAVANRKGGVGKTTTAVNLGAALAGMGQRVLLADLDPSGDLTNHVGAELQDGDVTVYEVIADGADIQQAIRHVTGERTGTAYDVIPADGALENIADDVPQTRLRDALAHVSEKYDYIILDAQPTLGAPTAQVLTAADSVIIPTGANYLAMDAVTATAQVIDGARETLNPHIDILGVLLTQYNPRIRHQQTIRDAISEILPGKVLDVYTSTGIGVAEAAAEGVDLYEYIAGHRKRKNTKASEQYRQLAELITKREVQ